MLIKLEWMTNEDKKWFLDFTQCITDLDARKKAIDEQALSMNKDKNSKKGSK